MASQPGRAFSRMDLLDAAQGEAYEGYERSIDVHIKNLRQKLGDEPRDPTYVLTVYGVGYKFSDKVTIDGGKAGQGDRREYFSSFPHVISFSLITSVRIIHEVKFVLEIDARFHTRRRHWPGRGDHFGESDHDQRIPSNDDERRGPRDDDGPERPRQGAGRA